MEIRFQQSPKETAGMNTQELRSNFLMESVMQKDEIKLLYTHYDRVIMGGVMPVNKTPEFFLYIKLVAAGETSLVNFQ